MFWDNRGLTTDGGFAFGGGFSKVRICGVLFWDHGGLTTDGGLLLGVGSQKLGFVVFCFGIRGD